MIHYKYQECTLIHDNELFVFILFRKLQSKGLSEKHERPRRSLPL